MEDPAQIPPWAPTEPANPRFGPESADRWSRPHPRAALADEDTRPGGSPAEGLGGDESRWAAPHPGVVPEPAPPPASGDIELSERFAAAADYRDEVFAPPPEAVSDPDPEPDPAAYGRRISRIDEIRDGGYGVGSAAPFPDRAQPLGHPVQAFRDTMTYRTPGSPGYDTREPDLWFYDDGAAERCGFTRAADG